MGAGRSVDIARIERAVREVLAGIGADPDGEELRETPSRVAEAYAGLFAGLHEDPLRHLEVAFPQEARDLVLLRDLPVASMCEHHLLPFVGKAHVGYVPDGKVVGLSEIVAVVEGYARRPQIQERLTAEIVDALHEPLGSLGSIVIVEAEQLCMTMRGAQKPGTITVTSAARGVFERDPARRAEVMALVSAGR